MKNMSIPRSLLIAAACCVLALIVMVVSLVVRAQPPAFVPPAFDETAQEGVPEAPAELGWCEVYKAGMSFRASVCGVFQPEGNQADYTSTARLKTPYGSSCACWKAMATPWVKPG